MAVDTEVAAGLEAAAVDIAMAADVVAFPFLKYAVIWEEGDEHRFHEILRDAMVLDNRYPRLEAWIRRMDELPRA